MKQDWEEIQLGDLCEFRNGLWKGKKPPFVTSKVIRMTNFTKECEMNTIEPIELEVEEKQYSSRSLIDGDLLLEKSGGGPKQPVGRVVRFEAPDNGNYSFSNFTTRIRISKLDKIDSKYLHKYLKFFYLIGRTEPLQSNSTNIRNLQLPAFKKILIPVPPLEEQKQIVAKLDQCFEAVDKARANAAKNLENAKELFQSKLNDIFSQKGEGWVDGVLIDVAKVINGYAFKSGDFSTSNNIKSIKITNVGVGKFVEEEGNYLPKEYSKRHQAVKISKGDLVIALTRTIISGGLKIAKVPESYDGALLNQRVAGIIANESLILAPILNYFFQSKVVSDYVLSNVNTLMQPNLSIQDLKMMPIPIPPMDDQNIISLSLGILQEQTQSLESKYQQELNSLEELKKSILQKAFEGEL